MKYTRPTEAQLAELRPLIHHHVTLLSAAGIAPTEALAIAAECAALCYSALLEEALAKAFEALGIELCMKFME